MASRVWRSVSGIATLSFLPSAWRLPCFAALGVFVGLGLAVANVSRAASYLSDAPEACTNCHVMLPQYATWQHGSHARVAVCNDCHVPHDSFVAHYAFKVRDGLRHSTMFTLRLEPQVIRMSDAAVDVVEDNCRRCHAALVEHVALDEATPGRPRCWHCHRDVPHGDVRSLSATPRIIRPELPHLGLGGGEPHIGGRAPRPVED